MVGKPYAQLILHLLPDPPTLFLCITRYYIQSFLLFVFRRKIIYFIGVIIPALYIAYAAVPIEYACIKEGSPIYLLPMENSTTFEVTSKRLSLEVQGSITGFKKIKLENNKIGWVKNEDLCVR